MSANTQSCKMKKVLPALILFFILGCSFPFQVTLGTPTATATLEATSTPTQTPQATAQPGTDQNPLILALAPSTHPNEAFIAAGDVIAAFIESKTGYRVVTVIPSSELALVEAFANGNAQIASLTPYGFVVARGDNSVSAVLARVRDGQAFYGAQIIANRDKDFIAYFDEALGENTAEAADALKQFEDKKPCWSDEESPSGYVVPLGLLTESQVQPRSGAFLEGQPNVVRAVYADDICDFGATFIDARANPILEADYPDVLDKINVVWRIPEIIPYENISIASSLPFEMRRVIQRAMIDLMGTPEGKAAMQTVYGFDDVQPVEDVAYDAFITYVNASGIDLEDLIK